ncbi:hypothetical protein G9447_11360 [Actinopolyspora sp. BKK1]|nr:hypothetical protein [Actinopolyspora sp. BKK2]NHE76799.1 hypothetical protein [Actinopolyspora sp. BKK1]
MTTENPGHEREMDLTRPCAARIADAFLGGCHNFGAERGFVERAELELPGITGTFRRSRDFLRRAVDHALSCGIRQFIDLGSGLPTVGHIHEIANRITRDHRVVYVDNEPLTARHGARLLAGQPRAALLHEDCRDAEAVLNSPELRRLIDPDEPIALVLSGTLHFLPDSAEARAVVDTYRDAVPAGSHLVLGHFTDSLAPESARALRRLYAESSDPLFTRGTDWIETLFGDFEQLRPGTGLLASWRPDPRSGPDDEEEHPVLYGGVARKRVRSTRFRSGSFSAGALRRDAPAGEPQQHAPEHGDTTSGHPRRGQTRVGGQHPEQQRAAATTDVHPGLADRGGPGHTIGIQRGHGEVEQPRPGPSRSETDHGSHREDERNRQRHESESRGADQQHQRDHHDRIGISAVGQHPDRQPHAQPHCRPHDQHHPGGSLGEPHVHTRRCHEGAQ